MGTANQILRPHPLHKLHASLTRRIRAGATAFLPKLTLRYYTGNGAAIRTSVSKVQRLALFEEASARIQLGLFLEIGSYLGATAVTLAAAMHRCSNGTVYCVDTWQNETMNEGKRSTFDEFKENTDAFTNIIPIIGRSASVQMPFTGQVDLVFIDGDHSYAGVKADVERFSPFVREGGCLALHDHSHFPTVTRVLGELLVQGGWFVSRAVENIIFLTRDSRWQADLANPEAVSPLRVPATR